MLKLRFSCRSSAQIIVLRIEKVVDASLRCVPGTCELVPWSPMVTVVAARVVVCTTQFSPMGRQRVVVCMRPLRLCDNRFVPACVHVCGSRVIPVFVLLSVLLSLPYACLEYHHHSPGSAQPDHRNCYRDPQSPACISAACIQAAHMRASPLHVFNLCA